MRGIYQYIICTCLALMCSGFVHGQALGRDKFEVEGITMDATTLKTMPYVNVVCTRTNEGVTSNGNGGFTIELLPGDTLLFTSVGYQTQKLRIIPDSAKAKKMIFVHLDPQRYELNQVNVEGKEGVPQSLQSEMYKDGPSVGDALASPTSYLYYKFSKKEKRKRALLEELEKDNNMAHVLSIYNKDLIAEFSGLEGKELEQCIIYCNTNIDLSPNDTEQSIKMKLLNLLSNYF